MAKHSSVTENMAKSARSQIQSPGHSSNKKKPQITLNGKKKCINLSASEPAGHCIADAMHRPRQILPPSPRCIERNGPTIYVSGETEQWSERRDFTAHVMH